MLYHVLENTPWGHIHTMPDVVVLRISALIKICFLIFLYRNTNIQNKESRWIKHRVLDCSSSLDSETVSPLENLMRHSLNN